MAAPSLPFIHCQWDNLLGCTGHTPGSYTLHSLRHGTADFLYNTCRTDVNYVMNQGTWRSNAVGAYIRPDGQAPNSVHNALSSLASIGLVTYALPALPPIMRGEAVAMKTACHYLLQHAARSCVPQLFYHTEIKTLFLICMPSWFMSRLFSKGKCL